MNIKQAKERFTIQKLLSMYGYAPDKKKSKPHDLWYVSPFRPNEKEASFHIDPHHDVFKDFGAGEKGGDLIEFVKLFLKYRGYAHETSDALAWLKELDGGSISTPRVDTIKPWKRKKREEPYKILSAKTIFSKSLFAYLDKRGISRSIARQYLKQIYFERVDSGKRMYGLGHKMRSGGYDIRNTFDFKTTIGKKDVTIIKGSSTGNLDIYEGIMDFLTRLTLESTPTPTHDSLIMNSTALYERAFDHIKRKSYSSVTLWHDNDDAGMILEQNLAGLLRDSPRPVKLQAMNQVYQGYKDLNDWHVKSNMSSESKRNKLRLEPRVISTDEDGSALSA